MEKEKKLKKYKRLRDQLEGYLGTTGDIWARLATIEAVLHHKIQYFFWTGVYILQDGELIVRSYQGPVACQKLRTRQGVCWAAVEKGETVIVDNVEEFPGHIACNAASKSEIVIPLKDKDGNVFACLDVDSKECGSFDEADEEGLKMILDLIYSVPVK